MNSIRWSVQQVPPSIGPVASEPVRLTQAWFAAAVSFVVVVAAAVWGPTPGDPTWWMVVELALVAVFGLGGAVTAAWFAEGARRRGRDLALVALFLAAFLALQASLRLVGTLGRFYGWDA